MFKAFVAACRAWRLVRIKQKIKHHSCQSAHHDLRRSMWEKTLQAGIKDEPNW